MNTPRTIVTLGAVAVLGAAGGAAVVGVVGDGGGSDKTVVQPAANPPKALSVSDPSHGLDAKQVYNLARNSVAYITSDITAQSSEADPFSEDPGQAGTATGSGFVVSKQGYIVTNAHVVNGAADVTVKVGDGKTEQAKVIGKDESTDIAVIKVAANSSYKPLAFGDSDKLSVGDPVFAIGNPFGLDRTLTTGVVSALNRQIQAPNGYTINGVVQTDAPINPGNSGGPLLDDEGQVIGINSQIQTGSDEGSAAGSVGIGFAAPSDTVRNVVRQLEQSGSVKHAYLGVSMGAAENGSAGAVVGGVTANGPAASAGIQQGDTIIGFDGKPVESPDALSGLVNGKMPGEKVQVEVRRDGTTKTVTVTLGTQPASATDQQAQQGEQGADPQQQGIDPTDPSQGRGGGQGVDPTDPSQGGQGFDPSDPSQGGQGFDPSDPSQGGQGFDPSDPSQQGVDPSQGQGQQIDPQQLLQQLLP